MQSQPGLPVLAGREMQTRILPPLILQRGASAAWPPARLFPPSHHHSCPTLLGNPALSPGPKGVPSCPSRLHRGSGPQALSAVTI